MTLTPLTIVVSSATSNEVMALIAVVGATVGFVTWWTRKSRDAGALAYRQQQTDVKVERLEKKVDGLSEDISTIKHVTTSNGGRNNPPTLPDKLATVMEQNEKTMEQNERILALLGYKPEIPKPRQPGGLFD